MDEHQLISALKQLAQELGVTPTHNQFQQHVGKGSSRYRMLFGGWNQFCTAAGISPTRESPRKITNEIFKVDLTQHLEEYKPRIEQAKKQYPEMAIISDIHWPFHSQKIIDRFMEYCGDVKPQYIFLNGDAWDFYSHSRFPRTHNTFTPKDEEEMARQLNIKFWEDIKFASPDSECTQMLGNHDIRPMRRVLETYPEASDWIKDRMNKLFLFDGIRTIFDPREEVMIGDICVFHGYRGKLGEHRDFTLFNCINGHSHVGGVVFRRIRGQTLWELNSGLAGDPEAKGLTYTPQKITNWTPGFAVVNKNGPQFVSY